MREGEVAWFDGRVGEDKKVPTLEDDPLPRLSGPGSREDFIVSDPSIEEMDMLVDGRWFVDMDNAGRSRPLENGRDVGGGRDELVGAF